jgi:molybdopterin molybdotransferase
MIRGHAWRVVTGACVPPEAEAVVRREDTEESDDSIRLTIDPGQIPTGQYIRRQGENVRAGTELIASGTPINPGVIAALASFGCTNPLVHRRVNVGLLTTGDELVPPSEEPPPWKIRDANGPVLRSLLGPAEWLELVPANNARDSLEALEATLTMLLGSCDVVIATGGVSMGNRDFVPAAVERVGGQTVFHKLRQKPGKPMLGAVGPAGQAVLGLPGNPVSVMVTARRFAYAILRRLGGFSAAVPPTTLVTLRDPDDERLDLWWHRPVKLCSDGEAELLSSRGSGDIAASARSDGFVCFPPGHAGRGPWPYWSWRLPE